jgi:ribosome-associated protein
MPRRFADAADLPPPAPTDLTAGAEPSDAGADRPSKSQRKRDSHALQDLGEALVALPPARFAATEMPDLLREAVVEYRRTRSHEGRRRQMQLIGRLMRQADVEPIRHAVMEQQLGRAQDSLALHEAERWRAELLEQDEALARWLVRHPDTDVQHLRSLIRAARKEGGTEHDATARGAAVRKGRAYRELFQFIRDNQTT